MGVKISGVGSYLPKTAITREGWAKGYANQQRYGQISEDFYDIPDKVHHADASEGGAFMGAQACLGAIEKAGLKRDDIDLVLCFSTVNDQMYPKDGQAIVNLLGLPNATALDLDLACSSFQALLKVGSALINQGMHKRIALVCTANWVHRAIDKEQDYRPLGDGAAAVILEQAEENSLVGFVERREERFYDFVKMPNAAMTKQQESIQFKFTDEFKHFLKTSATNVAKELMVQSSCMPQDVSWLICHQVGVKALEGWCRTLEFPPEKLLNSYKWTGNCMASNMPLVLDHYINLEPRIKRGDLILFYALSSGFHASALLWRY